MEYQNFFFKARKAFRSFLEHNKVDDMLKYLAEQLEKHIEPLLAANQKDLDSIPVSDPRYDRLKLTADRIANIATDMRNVAALPSPLGKVLEHQISRNDLEISKISVPLGVIGFIYEERPSLTFTVFTLCIKSGNACILNGNNDAKYSNEAAVILIQKVLRHFDIDISMITMLPPEREAAKALLNAQGFVDVVIPRGSHDLIDFVRENAKVPVIETSPGIVHIYYDKSANREMALALINNSKTRRVSSHNALECLIVHNSRLLDLSIVSNPLADARVIIYADERAMWALVGRYPSDLLKSANEISYGTDFLDYKLAVKTVDNMEQALEHISCYGSGHCEVIISEDPENIELFLNRVDAAVVYVNASTAFTDGIQFGLGIDIGISSQKLHVRGPIGLNQLTSYKWVVRGKGHVRE